MTARIKISQAGLAAGVAGRSRTDGLATGALVTLEDVSGAGDGTSTFHLLWGPPDDTTAEASLAVTGDLDIWTFSPQAARYGSYKIELRVKGVPIERRIFGIRTPANGLLIPALNERASRHANWTNEGADQIDLCEQNANDFPLSVLNNFRYAGWWRSLYELYRIVELGTGSIANNALALAKLVQATLAPSVIGASANGNFVEMPLTTLTAAQRYSNVVAATVSGTINNFNPTGWSAGTADKLALTLSADTTLNGIDSSVFSSSAGKELEVEITAGNFVLTVTHDNVGSTLGNRFSTPGFVQTQYQRADRFVIRKDEFGYWAIISEARSKTSISKLVRGLGLTVDGANGLKTRGRPRLYNRQDWFDTGNNASGTIGSLNWNLTGVGTPVYTRVDANADTFKGTLATSAATNDIAALHLGNTAARQVLHTQTAGLDLAFGLRPNATLTNTRLFIGFSDNFAVAQRSTPNCFGLYYDSAVGANWQVLKRVASVEVMTNTGVAVAGSTDLLLSLTRVGSGPSYEVRLGNTIVDSPVSGIPAQPLNVGFFVQTLTTASQLIGLIYYGAEALLVGSLDDDTFREV